MVNASVPPPPNCGRRGITVSVTTFALMVTVAARVVFGAAAGNTAAVVPPRRCCSIPLR